MRLIDFIICDDIRQEIGGKVTLVGVYEDRIMINAPSAEALRWPVRLRLGFFIRLLNDGSLTDVDGFDLQVRCNDKTLCRLSGPVQLPPRDRLMNLFFVNSSVRVPGEGGLGVALIFKRAGAVVREIRPDLSIQVRVAAPAAATPAPPPQVTRH